MTDLTERQREVLATFAALTVSLGPTIRALGDALGIKSTNGVADHLKALERLGLIKRWANAKSRAYILTEAGKALLRD
jgi:repressor LexA